MGCTGNCKCSEHDAHKIAFFDTIRSEIRRIAFMMEGKFRLHDRDRGNPFKPISIGWLEQRQDEERIEMLEAMGMLFNPDERKPPSVVWKEAADRCNFILMEAINYEREWKEGFEKRG